MRGSGDTLDGRERVRRDHFPPTPHPLFFRYATYDSTTSSWHCLPCPTDEAALQPAAYCPGDHYLPVPELGYWVDRRNIELAGNMYPCERTSGDIRDPRCGIIDKGNPAQAWRSLSAARKACWRREVLLNSTLADACAKDSIEDTSCIENSGGPFCTICVDTGLPVYSISAGECVKCDGSSATPVIVFVAVAVPVMVVSCSSWAHGLMMKGLPFLK